MASLKEQDQKSAVSAETKEKERESTSELLKDKERKHKHKSKAERDPNRPHRKRERKIDPETGEVVKTRRKKEREKGATIEGESSKPRHREKEADVVGVSTGLEERLGTQRPIVRRHSSAMTDVVPELAKTGSKQAVASRTNLPFPTLARAYSKEAIYHGEGHDSPSRHSPEATDISAVQRRKSKSVDDLKHKLARRHERPPSPPETEFSEHKGSATSRRSKVKRDEDDGDDRQEERPSSRRSKTTRHEDSHVSGRSKREGTEDGSERPGSRRSKSSRAQEESVPRKSKKEDVEDVVEERPSPRRSKTKEDSQTSKTSRASTAIRSSFMNPTGEKRYSVSGLSKTKLAGIEKASSKDALRARQTSLVEGDLSPASIKDSSPGTPTLPTPISSYKTPQSGSKSQESPKPPPPPPPPSLPQNVPQVDYLLKYGGLARPVSKNLLSDNHPLQVGTRTHTPVHGELSQIFRPFHNVLDQYQTVMERNGSLAVATGYRSVARRLLDRLEAVFARDLPSEGCTCVVCLSQESSAVPSLPTPLPRGLNWGEVLEWVSGRRELPVWPPFDFASLAVKAGEHAESSTPRPSSPIKIDPDVAPEFRQYYLQQTAKTTSAVNKWLSSCPVSSTPLQSPEVDEDTLTFAIITHITPEERTIFHALQTGSASTRTSASPARKQPRSPFIVKTCLALQRLHRLPRPPHDAETVLYLLRNPQVHCLLSAITAIKPQEWEILTSGRFDGFLWSGSEQSLSTSPKDTSPTSRDHSSATRSTPLPRGQTPIRNPVSNDEESEIAALAEVEREIYVSMEALEDAFEVLHRRAEEVRRGLRERSAGLLTSLEHRRTMIFPAGTPAPPTESESETGELDLPIRSSGRPRASGLGIASVVGDRPDSVLGWDTLSELAPDDSASNISSSRHRRPKRRTERRTPAPVEEEDEG